jgi:hypothetical protein
LTRRYGLPDFVREWFCDVMGEYKHAYASHPTGGFNTTWRRAFLP